ncbi:cytochrome P450 [Melanogaster broomeanus]|nr:cytochrome P450 [Melanogaster broomeanus]
MQLHVPPLPEIFFYSLAGILAVVFVIAKLSRRTNLDAFPTVGSSTWLGSWWSGIKFVTNASDIIQEGYKKHKGGAFKVVNMYSWLVIVSGTRYVDDIRNASDDELSNMEAINDASSETVLAKMCSYRGSSTDYEFEYTLGHDVHYNPYHVQFMRSQLTRGLGTLYPAIRDEVVTAFEERTTEWKSVPAFAAVQKIVCRTSNRIFVGLPLCRDPDWIDLNIRFTFDAIKGGIIIGLFPNLVARFMTNVPETNRRAVKHLGPIIEERLKHLEENGNAWADKPHDLISWLMDEAEGSERTIKAWTQRVLAVNFAAVHTSANRLYNLATNPQYIQPLREEVESVVATEGWSKDALGKMYKIDSFLRESQRIEGNAAATMVRKVLKDFRFSDGKVIPKGAFLAVAANSTHLDDELYENAHKFDPFRFANMRDEYEDGINNQFVSLSPEYLPFGLGRHACPGRYFAANELKSMLAHVVTSYDIKLENSAKPPQNLRVGIAIAANVSAKVMFRKRAH